MREFKEQFGFLTIAQNTDVDYLHLAYLQAQNIKATQKLNSYAVILDEATAEHLTRGHRQVFDHIIILPNDCASNETWKQSNEWQVFNLTPFKETIKLESDLLFTRDITHWLDALRLKEICFSYHCLDYQEQAITETPYRQIFKLNDLPDIYTGMYYFRYSRTAAEFFRLAKNVYSNWTTVKENIVQSSDAPSTDLAMSITAKLFGQEQCYIPTLDFFNFVHIQIFGKSNTFIQRL